MSWLADLLGQLETRGGSEAVRPRGASSGSQGDREQQVTEWLIEQARDSAERLHGLVMADERLMAIGISLLGTASSLAVAENKSHLLMALPFALSVLFCFVEHLHVNLMGIGGYKSVLEEKILVRTGVPIDIWETAIAPKIHRNGAVTMLRYLILAFYCGSVYVAIDRALDTRTPGHWGHGHSTFLVSVTFGTIVLGAVATLVARHAASTQYDRVASITRAEMTRLQCTVAPPTPTRS